MGKKLLTAIIANHSGDIQTKPEWIKADKKSADDIASAGIASFYVKSFITKYIPNHAELNSSDLFKMEAKSWKAFEMKDIFEEARNCWLKANKTDSSKASSLNTKGLGAISAQILYSKGLISKEDMDELVAFSELPYPEPKKKEADVSDTVDTPPPSP